MGRKPTVRTIIDPWSRSPQFLPGNSIFLPSTESRHPSLADRAVPYARTRLCVWWL